MKQLKRLLELYWQKTRTQIKFKYCSERVVTQRISSLLLWYLWNVTQQYCLVYSEPFYERMGQNILLVFIRTISPIIHASKYQLESGCIESDQKTEKTFCVLQYYPEVLFVMLALPCAGLHPHSIWIRQTGKQTGTGIQVVGSRWWSMPFQIIGVVLVQACQTSSPWTGCVT